MGEVEEGISPPLTRRRKPRSLAGERAIEMKVGSSVVCDDITERDKLRYALAHLGYKTCSAPEGVIGYRVWRLS